MNENDPIAKVAQTITNTLLLAGLATTVLGVVALFRLVF